MAALLRSLERRCNFGFSDMNYCPETVLVHGAFLLADKEAGQSLIGAEKGNCRRVIQIVSEAIREITREAIQDNARKLLQVEMEEFEFKIHSWVFTSLLKSYGIFGPGEPPEEDYFDSFPPLPKFDIKFYLQLVHEMGWGDLLVESLCTVGVENVTSVLEDIIKCLAQQPSFNDLSLFHTLFSPLLVTGKQNSLSDNQDMNLDSVSPPKCCSLLLLQGVADLAKDFSCWPEAQMDVIKSVIDFTLVDIIDLNFKTQSLNKRVILPENSIPNEGHLFANDEVSAVERTSNVKSEQDDNTTVNAKETATSNLHPTVSAEVTAGVDLLCQVIMNDWRMALHWFQSEICGAVAGEIDYSSWHPLHKWIVKLYAMSCWLVSHCLDNTLLDQVTRLQNGLAEYVKTYSIKTELIWIDGFRRGELIESKELYVNEEFSPPTESVDLLLFQPETTEEQFQFYLQQVNGRLEGHKECFDWLLGAEEFHRESDWLECMKNHAVQISDIQHVLKMIDIIFMQQQLLCSCDETTDVVYSDMKEILLSLFSTFPCSAQEQIIEYAFFLTQTSSCSADESLFFHPHFITQERLSFQQDLVMVFNKLIDINNEYQLQSAMKDLARAALISPCLTINKAVLEGVKSIGHSKSICSVLQKLPTVCSLRCNDSTSSQTLLCQAVNSVTMSVGSRQQENNLLNMVSIMLCPGSSECSPLLSVEQFTETVVLPFVNNTNMQGDIPTVLSLKLLNASMTAVMADLSQELHFLSKDLFPIILCLCELLNESNAFWTDLVPVHSLSEMEELRELVLKALDTGIKLCRDVLEMNTSFVRGVEWLLKRVRSDFDWTVLLHLKPLFSAANIKCELPVPHCLLNVCEDLGEEWVEDKGLAYGKEDVLVVLFEYCRVSEVALQRILESLIPNRLINSFPDVRRCVVNSLAQVLPHCTWKEWKRILELCLYFIRKNILEAGFQDVSCLQANDNAQDGVRHLSALLLDMMEAIHSPLCFSWATPHVYLYVTRHYITALKEMVDQTTDASRTAQMFAHVCHVMTLVPADCEDQLFVLALDLVARPSILNDDVTEQLRLSINSLSSEVYKAALMQKLNRNL